MDFKLLALGLALVVHVTTAGSIRSKLESFNRKVRSPQFSFTGRDVLSDLAQQIKPPTLSDFNDFRQKVANLANFTALLEQALEAERAARSSLQNFVTSIKEQVMGIQTAVNPDPENYWMESKECGGVVVSQTGKILYKHNEYSQNNERCIWTVRANYRSKIKVTLTRGTFEDNHDLVGVTELVDPDQWITKRLVPGQTSIFNGPLVLISFVSDGSIRSEGFQLDFEGLGSNIGTRTLYLHFHTTDWVGHFDSTNISKSLESQGIEYKDGVQLKVTAAIIPSYLNLSKLQLWITEGKLDLQPEDCETTQLAVYNELAFMERGSSRRCCGGKCEQMKFDTSNRIMLAVFTSNDYSKPSQFEINWTTDIDVKKAESRDTCGGLLKGDQGEISYQFDGPYENNERCLWVVTGAKNEKAEIKVQLLSEGFEHHYDYITLSYFKETAEENDLTTDTLYKASKPIIIKAPFIFVQFYSDEANFGKTSGFRFLWEVKYTAGDPFLTDFEFSKEPRGNAAIACEANQGRLQDVAIQKFHVINPKMQNKDGSGSTVILEPKSGEPLSVFSSERGKFSKLERTELENYRSNDGIFIVHSQCSISNENEDHGLLEWKTETRQLENPEGPEKKLVKSVDECGELLYGDAGRISYKLGKEYDLNERCTWIIKAKSFTTVSFKLMADGFESCCDGLQINRIDTNTGLIDTKAVIINRENRFHTMNGPVILLTFYSDHSVNGTGFSIEFETKGVPPEEDDVLINHWHVQTSTLPTSENPFGPVFVELSQNAIALNTFQFQGANETGLLLTMDNLETNDCQQDMVALYHMPEITAYQLLKQYPNKDLCLLNALPIAEASTVVLQQENVRFKGPLLVVAKIREASPDKSLSVVFSK